MKQQTYSGRPHKNSVPVSIEICTDHHDISTRAHETQSETNSNTLKFRGLFLSY